MIFLWWENKDLASITKGIISFAFFLFPWLAWLVDLLFLAPISKISLHKHNLSYFLSLKASLHKQRITKWWWQLKKPVHCLQFVCPFVIYLLLLFFELLLFLFFFLVLRIPFSFLGVGRLFGQAAWRQRCLNLFLINHIAFVIRLPMALIYFFVSVKRGLQYMLKQQVFRFCYCIEILHNMGWLEPERQIESSDLGFLYTMHLYGV